MWINREILHQVGYSYISFWRTPRGISENSHPKSNSPKPQNDTKWQSHGLTLLTYCWWFRNPANHLGCININPVNNGIFAISTGFLAGFRTNHQLRITSHGFSRTWSPWSPFSQARIASVGFGLLYFGGKKHGSPYRWLSLKSLPSGHFVSNFPLFTSWWLNQPNSKIWVKMGIFPKFRGEHEKIESTT